MTATASRLSARELLEEVLDAGSFRTWDEPIALRGDDRYRAELVRARESTGVDESILSGEGRVGGHRVAVIVSEFGFLGGSIGVDAAARVARAITRATRERLPLLAAPASGGTRMQEGTVAFVQMVTITAAVENHRREGLPFLVYLRHPTTGGVFASWGSLGHVTVAEPGAMIGFLGPRVFEAIHGRPFTEGVQRAENLFAHGLVDAVIGAEHLGALTVDVLDAWRSRGALPGDTDARAPRVIEDDWVAVSQTRTPARPGLRSVLRQSTLRPVRLNGTGRGESDPSLALAIARFGGHGVIVMGHDRRADPAGGGLTPGGLRIAARGIRLAEELSMPLVTIIDTSGAQLSEDAEEGGLAGEIARCLLALLAASVPTVSIILGQGTGGGALALLPADRILATEDAWLSPLPPEGASAIMHRDTSHAPELARAQRIGAGHLWEDQIVDRLFSAGDDLARSAATAIAAELDALTRMPEADRLLHRRHRFAGLQPR